MHGAIHRLFLHGSQGKQVGKKSLFPIESVKFNLFCNHWEHCKENLDDFSGY